MLGRMNRLPDQPLEASPKFYLRRLRFQDGDYDEGGAYWGYTPGTAIYRAVVFSATAGLSSGNVIEVFTRAASREGAKLDVLEVIPYARFYR